MTAKGFINKEFLTANFVCKLRLLHYHDLLNKNMSNIDMVKWADYLISAVRYNVQHTHILTIRRHLDNGDNIANPNIVNRNIVTNDLKNGKSYKTIYKNNQGKWKQGEDVRLIGNTGFITTDPNKVTRDNLGNLPEF